MFVTEFGIVEYTGTGTVDTNSGTTWLNLLDSLKISYAGWNWADAAETGAALKPNSCASNSYGTSSLQQSGAFMRSRIMTSDNFPTS
jgi:endoglucanase